MENKKRLVDANKLIDFIDVGHLRHPGELCYSEVDVANILLHAPTVDAVEVVHAEWLYDGGSGKYFCSACDADALSFKKDALYGGDLYEVCLTDYCPSCGAKMDGGNG